MSGQKRNNNNQGRFSGRGFSRGRDGNQGNRSGAKSNNSNKNDSRGNAEMKFVPHYSGKQLMCTYHTVKNHIVL